MTSSSREPDRSSYIPTECVTLPQMVPANAFVILAGLFEARLALMTGNGRIEITMGDRTSIFNKTNPTHFAALTADILRWCKIAKGIDSNRYVAEGWDTYEREFTRSNFIRMR